MRWGRNGGPAYYTSPVETGDIKQVVEATGTINAVITVQVGSQVSGVISELDADFNSQVKNGDIIARIDPALFQGALAQAKADLQNAEASVAVAVANTAKAKASQVQMKADYDRSIGLVKTGSMSQQAFEIAKANADSAEAQVAAAEAQEKQARAQVEQKRAAIDVAQTNVDYTTIRAPIDGTVVARNVDVGQTVAASLQAPTLFTIAQDLTKMLVYTKTDESDVGGIHSGQKVTFKVDAYPREAFTGAVSQVRMNSTVVQNVVTYDTIIEFDNPEKKLFPGMTAYVVIPVATAAEVLKVPNAALRFKPDLQPEEILALYRKFGIPEGEESTSETKPIAQNRTAAARDATSNQSTKAVSGPRTDTRIVWKLGSGGRLEPVRIKTGITDHTNTELVQRLNGTLKPGDSLVTGVAQSHASANAPRSAPGVTRTR
ncbi:MAG: efflux RND transporter periplasmic adaptor subunit [Chthoniobacterales bacterium]